MKNKITFLLTALFLLTITPHAEAKQYCGEKQTISISVNGVNNTYTFDVTYELLNNQYTITYTNGKNTSTGKAFVFSTERCYDNSATSMKTWTITDGGNTITKTFSSIPAAPKMYGYTYDGYNNKAYVEFTFSFPADMTWGPCISDSEKPVISTVSASNIGNTSATIKVAATDNTGITKVVIKNAANELVNQTITATPNLNGSYSVTGLTKNTSYTLTVTVFDAAGNTSDAKTVTFTTTNTKEPTINSAAHASSTATQIILNVTATDANKYKVVERNDLFSDKILEVSSGNATNGQITITGLSGSTTYNLRVYAMWDGTMSTNYKDLTVTTPLGSQCDGTRSPASGSGTALKYEIMFDGTDVNITLQSANSDDPLETCIVESYINKGSSATQFANVTAVNGVAVATFNRPLREIEYIRFQYKTRNMSSATSTANGSHESAKLVYYVVGDCQPDPDVPYMKSVTKAGATTTSITLNVSAIVNGGANTVTQFMVSVDGAAAQTLTATNGQITVTGLSANTSYNFEVWALYNGNTSENSKTVTASTNKESECWGTRGHFADATWATIDYEIAFEGDEMKVEVTCSTKTLTTLQIQWDIPGIVGSAGFENFTNGVYTKKVTEAMLGNPMLIRIQYGYTGRDGLSVTAEGLGENSKGIIYYVVGECGAEDTEDPKINAFVPKTGNTTADVHVVASDDTGITQIIIKDENDTPVLTETIKRLTTLDATYTITGLTKNTTYSGYTVTVIDRADKSVEVTLPNFTTTNTPEPNILSAVVDGEPKSSSVVLAVTSEQANQYKVVEKDGKFADQILTVTSGTPDNGQITITSLKGKTDYTVYVYAMYDNTESVNFKEVTFTTPVGSECSGTRGSHTGDMTNAFDFSIDFDGENILFEFISKVDFDYLQIEWKNTDGSFTHNITSNNGITINSSDKKTATYTYTVPENRIGEAIGIRIIYSNTNMSGNEQTSLNVALDDPNIIYYKIGDCGCEEQDGDIPTLDDVTLAYTTPTSAVLNVRATDPSSVVTTYQVETKQGGSQVSLRDYYATDGQITISGLTSCETYTFIVKAKDPSCNLSENSITITAAKTTQNHVRQTGVTANYVKNTAPGNLSIDGLLNTRGGSQDERDDITIAEALNNSIFTVDLGTVRVISEIDIFWERACATDYELQASIDGNYWSTIRRYTDMPVWAFYAPIHGDSNMVYRFDEMPARYLRVKPNMLYVAAKWGMSIWEFEAYGPCDVTTMDCPVVLDVRAESIKAQSAVISVSGIDQQTVDPADLTYIVTTSTDVPGRRTITNTYIFTPEDDKRTDSDGKAYLTLEGLIPGTFYTISVTAKDPDKNESCNSNSTTLRTGKAEGCTAVIEGNNAIVEGDWKAFPSGMTYRIELQNNDEGTEFTVTLSFKGKPADMTINTVYCAVLKQATGADCYGGWIDDSQMAMTREGDIFEKNFSKDVTYTRGYQDGCAESPGQEYTYPLFTDWPNIELYFKIETSYGIIHSDYFNYNPAEKACEEFFIIFHEGSEPAEDMSTYYTGNTIPHEIFYYRLINPGQWTPLCLPFEVDRVEIFDPDDKEYYPLAAATDDQEGNYWIRQQKPNVSGEQFQKSWFNGTETIPQKGVPYNLTVPTGGYYDNKYLVFHGAAGQTVETVFALGTASGENDQYTLFGNNTMQPQLMTKAYKEDDDGKYYRLQENWTLNPFECYVLASAETMKRMPIIGRWNDEEEATSIDEVKAEMPLDEIHVYTTLGQHVTTLYQCSLRDAEMHIAQTMTAGCYIILGPQVKTKLLIP